MNNKTLGRVIIELGGPITYNEQQNARITSSIHIGMGRGVFFWKDKKNDIDT